MKLNPPVGRREDDNNSWVLAPLKSTENALGLNIDY
jgi:hypothetical protein